MQLVVIAGTRPEILKVVPVIVALQQARVEPLLLLTGQHDSLLAGTPLGLVHHVEPLHLPSAGNVPRWLSQVGPVLDRALQVVLKECGEAIVVVQGDTMSAYAGAQAAHRAAIPTAHIEAGVRSHSPEDPWPEEMFRTQITQWASWHYAPTSQAFAHLVSEGINPTSIQVTGNTSISALWAAKVTPVPAHQSHPRIMVTLHRRELTRDRERFDAVVSALLGCFAQRPDITGIWPVHPSIPDAQDWVVPRNVQLVPPIPPEPFLKLVASSMAVLTDSGGLVEECATLGVPTAILRYHNDRTEAEAAGIARRFDPTPEGVVCAVRCLLDREIQRLPSAAFGQHDAADLIANHLIGLADK